MDEIEYLEEYEDLILPTMSSHSTITKNRATGQQLTTNMADDEDSSSIDQDIFESLFDDHSDDESVMQKRVPAKMSQRSERSSRVSRMSMDSLDMLVKDLGEPLSVAAGDQQTKPTNKQLTKPSNAKVTPSTGKVMPKAATTSAATTTKVTTTPSNTSKDMNNKTANKSEATAAKSSTIDERNAKTKSVATVRPTVQQQSVQAAAKQTNSNAAATTSSTTINRNTTSANSTQGSSKPTTATSTSALASRKQVAAATSTTGSTSASVSGNSKASASAEAKPIRTTQPAQTTIVKPEKPQMKDPAEDPLSLENVDNETDSDTESFLYSDISADSFVSLSDVDDDSERQVIELSNDSNYDRVNLDKIRGSTPSPTVSDDDKSNDAPMKILSKRDHTTMEGSALEHNANATNTSANAEEATTSSQQKTTETTPTTNAETITNSVDESPNVSDTNLIERIDTVLSVTNAVEEEKEQEQKVDAECNMTVHEEENSETPLATNAMDVDDDDDLAAAAANTTDEGIQEPSNKENTTTMDTEMKDCHNDDEELNADDDEIEGGEEEDVDEEYEEMEEDETEDGESTAANTSAQAVDTLPNKSSEDIEQLPSETSGDVVVESHDNADVQEYKENLNNSEETQEESITPQEENDACKKAEENVEEDSCEVEKEGSNKNNENVEEKGNRELEQTSDSKHTENEDEGDMMSVETETLKEDELTAKKYEKKGAKEKVKDQPKTNKNQGRNQKNFTDDELKKERSHGGIAGNKGMEEKIIGEPIDVEKNQEMTEDIERSDGTDVVSTSNENVVEILDESQETERREKLGLTDDGMINVNTEKEGNEVQESDTKLDTGDKEEVQKASCSKYAEESRKNEIKKKLLEEINILENSSKETEHLNEEQQLEDKSEPTEETPTKTKRHTISGKQTRTPLRNRKTVSITEQADTNPQESDTTANETQDGNNKKDVRSSRRETAAPPKEVNTPKKYATTKDSLQEGSTPSSRSKTSKPSNESQKEDKDTKEVSTASTDKTSTETPKRKTRWDVQNVTSSQNESNAERINRSQTPQKKKVNKQVADKAKALESAAIQEEEPDEIALNVNRDIAETQTVESDHKTIKENEVKETQESQVVLENKADTTSNTDDKTKQREVREEKASKLPLTPKPDRRIRGLVVSLKKTDLSKVLNEKLVRNKEVTVANRAGSVSKNIVLAVDKTKADAKSETNVEINKEEAQETHSDSQIIESVEEQQCATPTKNANKKHSASRNKKQRRAKQQEFKSKQDNQNLEEGSDKANDAIANKDEHKEQINEMESEIASTSKAAAEKSACKAKAIGGVLPESNADVEKVENAKEADTETENENLDMIATIIGCAVRPKRRQVESETQEKEKKNLNAPVVETESVNQKQTNEHEALSSTLNINPNQNVQTEALSEDTDLAKEMSDNEVMNAAADHANETQTDKVEVTAVKRKRDNKTRSRARKGTKKSDSKMNTQETDESVHKIAETEVVSEGTEKEREQTESIMATEHTDNSQVKISEVQLDECSQPLSMEPNTAEPGSDDTQDKNMDGGEDETQETVFEPKTLRKRVKNPLDKTAKPEEVSEGKEEKKNAEEVIEDRDTKEENIFEPKTLRKRVNTPLDKKAKSEEAAEAKEEQVAAEVIEEKGEPEENIFEPKTLRKRVNTPLDKKAKPEETAVAKEEQAAAEEIIEDKGETEENIFEPKTLRKRVNNPLDKTVKPEEAPEAKEKQAAAEEKIEDKREMEENIFEPKTLRKRANNPLDKTVKPEEVAESKENTDVGKETEENMFEPKTLRKRVKNPLDKAAKPEEVSEGKEEKTNAEVMEEKDITEENIMDPKTLRKRVINPSDNKAKPKEVAESKDNIDVEGETENNVFEPKTLRKRVNNPLDKKEKPVADGENNIQEQGVQQTETSTEKVQDTPAEAEAPKDKDNAVENIFEAKTLRGRVNKKLEKKAEAKLVTESTGPVQDHAVAEVAAEDHGQGAETIEMEVDKLLDTNVESEEVIEEEIVVEPKNLRKRVNKAHEKIEEQNLVVGRADTAQVKTVEEVTDGKDITQGAKTNETDVDKLLDKNVVTHDEIESNDTTQETIVEPKYLRKRTNKQLEKEEGPNPVLAGTTLEKQAEVEVVNTSSNELLDGKVEAEVLNENVVTTQDKEERVECVFTENYNESVEETAWLTADDEPTEDNNDNAKTEPETAKTTATKRARRKTKRLTLRKRDRKRRSLNKKPEKAIKNENATQVVKSVTEVGIGRANVDYTQENESTVIETVSDNVSQAYSQSESEAVENENKRVESNTKTDLSAEPNDEKNADEATITDENNVKPASSKRLIEDEVARSLCTPIPKDNAEHEELDVGGSGEAIRSLRTRQLRQHTETSASATPSPATTPAHSSMTAGSEDDHEAVARRTLRKRGADPSPSSANELARKGLKATPSLAATNALKLTKDQSNVNRSHTVTPTTTSATRKRVRDISTQQNTTAERNDPDKSPLEKKTKLESLRKSSRMPNDAETSESEIETSTSQRRSRQSGLKDNSTNKNLRDNSASLERKAATPTAADAGLIETTLGSTSPRKRDKSATNSTNVAKSQTNTTQQQQQQQKQTNAKQPSARAREAAVDPLQIPTKRVRRLEDIDDCEAINVNEESNLPKRKSLRAVTVDHSDNTKTNDGNKTQVKQPTQQQSQQQHQQQRTSLGKKTDSTVGATATSGRSTTSALKAQISPTKSSPASKVLTFTEWLEQQKKNIESNGGEEGTTTEQAKEKPATHSKGKTSSAPATTVRSQGVNPKNVLPANLGAAKSKVFTASVGAAPAASTSKSTEFVNVSIGAEREQRQRPNVGEVRDAFKRNPNQAITTSASNKTQNVTTNAMAQAATTASAASRQAKTVPLGANDTNATNTIITTGAANRTQQFKRPSLPQKQTARTTTQRAGGNRTPTSVQGNNSTPPQHGKQAALHHVNIKSKLRKLRVRINRSTVPAYFRKLNLALSRGQVKNDVEQKFLTPSNTSLPPDNTTKDQRQSLPTLSQKRVAMKSALKQPQQLPTLTARPTVAAASSTNNLARLGGSLPALTKVPSSVERITTRPQDELNASNNTTTGYQHNNAEELSLLTPMKSVAVPTATTTSRSQQQQQKSQFPSSTAAEAIREKRTSATSTTDAANNTTRTQTNAATAAANTNHNFNKDATATPFTPFVPKEEIVEEQQHHQQQQQTTQTMSRTSTTSTAAVAADSSTTNSLASRTLAIAAATNSALSQPPTSDSSGYYGLTPTQIDTNGTRLYSFLHPAKYNRNHGCVLLDYCCPNLDGPMPAIDPTRIHAQVQAGVRELPSYIVMTTKLITRADLEANKSVIPASIRQKVEKITADSQTAANQMAMPPAGALNGTPNMQNPLAKLPTTAGISTTAAAAAKSSTLTPTLTALQKHLPSTTSITPKIMPLATASASSAAATSTSLNASNNSSQRGASTPTPATTSSMLLSDYQRSLLRTSVRQFDARLKKYYYRIALLSFSDRQKIIDNLITTTTLVPKDVECAVRLLDEYAAQISLLPTPPAVSGGPINTNPGQTTQQQSSGSKAIITPTTNTIPTRSNTIQQQQQHQQQHIQQNQRNSNGQGAVLDKNNSLLGYHLASSTSATMELNKSTVATRSSIMSTGLKNTSMPNVSTASGGVLPALKSAQDSPRIFYTKHPMQTSTPIATTTSSANNTMSGGKSISLRSTPRLGRDMTVRQIPSKFASVSSTSVTSTPPTTTRRLPSLTRNPHLLSNSNTTTPNSSTTTETITTRSAVTISEAPKRMTRASAAAKVIVITQNREGGTSTPLDECILPDTHDNTEIKREKIDDDFLGGN